MLRKDMLSSPQFAALDGNAVKLLLELARQFNGSNNGDLSIAWTLLKRSGWRSQATLHKAKDRLLEARFIVKTRQGMKLGHLCSLFALTWLPVDECEGKHDHPPERIPSNAWRTANHLVAMCSDSPRIATETVAKQMTATVHHSRNCSDGAEIGDRVTPETEHLSRNLPGRVAAPGRSP